MPTFFSAVPLFLRSLSCSVLGHPSLIFFNPSTVLAFYSKYDAKLREKKINSVEEFLLRGLARCCCDERTWQQRGLWIMKHMWPCAERGERHAWRGMTGWTASWAGGGWKCEFPKTTKNEKRRFERGNNSSCARLWIVTYWNRRGTRQLYLKENTKKERRWDFIYAVAWRLDSFSFIWLRWQRDLPSCSAKRGWLPLLL